MKRFEKCKRILAFLLVALMVVSQSSVTTLAEELSADAQNVQTQEEEATAESPEESEKDNPVQDTDNIEGQSETTPTPSETEATVTPEAAEPTVEPTVAPTEEIEEVTTAPEQEAEATSETTVSPEAAVTEEAVEARAAAEHTTDLNRLVDGITVTVDGNDATKSDGVYQVKPDTDYTVRLSFKETEEIQFANHDDGKLYYTLPTGLTIPADIPETTFSIGSLEGNTFSYTKGSDQIVVTLNTGSEHYDEFKKSATASFSLVFDARFSNEVEEIVFGSIKTVKVHVNNIKNLKLNKEASYNSKTGEVTYAITVESEGNNSNVVLTDTLSGTWLEMFTADAVQITSTSQKQDLSQITKTIDGRTMTVRIPSMSHDEKIRIKYTVKVNYDQMKPSSENDIVNGTTNTVTGNWDTDNTVSVDLKDKKIYSPAIAKTGTINASDNSIQYTITLNADYRYDISGKVITDAFGQGKQYAKYTGDGIKIKKYQSGIDQALEEKDIPWSAIIKSTGDSWSYTIPSTDTGKYKYVITYTAQGINNEITKADVYNEVSYDIGGSKKTSVRVLPVNGVLNVAKNGEVITDPVTRKKQIKWTVSFNVFANKEYTNCSIVDTLPSATINKIKCNDSYVTGSEEITGLLEGEQYEIVESKNNDGNNVVTVNFYYMDGNTKKPNLKVSDTDRNITFSYLTEPDPTWLENSNSLNNKTHTNKVTVKARGQSSGASADVNLYESNPEIKKTSKVYKEDSTGNAEIIRYDVTISGVDDSTIEIVDEFNTDQLVYDESNKPKFSYSENGKDFTEDKTAVITPTNLTNNETGLLFTIKNFHKNADENHAVYKLTYYLKVNGAKGLESIETSGEGGVVENKATFMGKADTTETVAVSKSNIIKKELSNDPSKDKYVAEYHLEINPEKKKYGTSDTLTVNDEMYNMEAINPDAVKITTDPVDKAKDVVTKFTDKGIVFTVPNSTKVEITYKAKWTGTGEIDHTNTVTVYGYSQSVNRKVNISSTADGTYSNLQLTVYKCEEGNSQKFLPGAEFKLQCYRNGAYTDVLDKNGNPVTFTTGTDGKNILAGDEHNLGWVLLDTYKYQLIETKAPAGYVLDSTPHQFTFSKNLATKDVTYCGDSGELIIYNRPIEVEISKTDITGSKELAGAQFKITDEKGTEVANWISGDDGNNADDSVKTHKINLAAGTYTLTEVKAPSGYKVALPIVFTVGETGTVTSTTAGVVDGNKVTVRDEEISVSIKKTDIVDGKELAGAHIQIVDQDTNKIFAEWDSDGKGAHTVTGLVAGKTYILRETKAPEGYTLAADTTFVLKEDGTIDADKTTANIENGNLVIRDALTSVNVSKKAATGEDELAGAHLQIVYKDEKDQDKIFAEWDSDGKGAHTVTGLVAGKTYILRETKAPDGYTLAADTTFVLKADGTIDAAKTTANVEEGNLVIRDALTSVSIKKTDIVDGKELAGATLQILDKDKNIVTTIKGEKLEWTSTGEAQVIEGLVAGETYYLHEVTAPTGYEVANDTKFVLKTDGTVDADNTTAAVKDGVLLVQDSMIKSEKASIEVTKTLVYEGTELGAADQTFYVALYGDEACTNRISDVKALVFKNTASATAKFTDLEVGRKYYVSECTADGTAETSGVLADAGQTAFIANFPNGNTVTVDNADGTKEIAFQNEFLKIPDGFYKVGKLTVTKKLLGSDGKEKNSSNTFYAGIFEDAAHTKLSESVSQNVIALALNGASSVSATVDVSVVEGTTTTLYVTEVDADGKPVADAESFKYDVNVDNEKVSFTDTNTKASATITNQEQSEEEDEETNEETEEETEITSTPTPTSSVTPANSQTSSAKSVKTGDNTPIAMFVLLLAVAVAVIAFIFIRRRKK